MKKFKLYTITFLAVGFVILLISFLSFQYLYKSSRQELFNGKLEAGKRESREIGKLLELQLKSGLSKQKVIQNLQNSIVNTDTESGFICMYDQTGIELCHPDPALVGQVINKSNSDFISGETTSDFIDVLNSGKENTGIRNFSKTSNRSSEIVSVSPVAGSDWMLASHINTRVIGQEISDLYLRFLLIFLLATLIILGSSFFLIRMIYKKYESYKERQVNDLNNEVNALTAMNNQLNRIHSNSNADKDTADEAAENLKKRLITYHKDELISLEATEIAYFFLENNIVYIKTHSGNQFSINSSLDELARMLDQFKFYRANRQYIVNISAISKILIYGKNQLKIIVTPKSEDDILISKNRVAEFKKWLDQ
ncbi:LytTr DNA-binding domain-containing protein [Chryseobacterium soldanellicola]|uniref:LytTr DNA-binding domain-containing protein n=1 Tax=Chryseobacterium soldanellicola TaxID=311333 RepID=A0A1H1FB57_9FLAO|nr:LytTR family DNA-binding domain-containing protein [Chryseobacterium soldanellicola]SDQ98140.1 LytTr DNA-binding domain-containing protein [Chryseobacterium soldanellicola]